MTAKCRGALRVLYERPAYASRRFVSLAGLFYLLPSLGKQYHASPNLGKKYFRFHVQLSQNKKKKGGWHRSATRQREEDYVLLTLNRSTNATIQGTVSARTIAGNTSSPQVVA